VTSWADVQREVPELAERVRARFDARKHKTMATLRSDGSPRISGIELSFADGELRFGSMARSVKGQDLRRDPRLAVHSPTVDPPPDDPGGWPGEAKIAGRAVRDGDGFRIDIAEVALTRLGAPADHLVIESWHPGRGYERRERR
jgi:pyridoxamine 5'-phosphate oxidase-like protein